MISTLDFDQLLLKVKLILNFLFVYLIHTQNTELAAAFDNLSSYVIYVTPKTMNHKSPSITRINIFLYITKCKSACRNNYMPITTWRFPYLDPGEYETTLTSEKVSLPYYFYFLPNGQPVRTRSGR